MTDTDTGATNAEANPLSACPVASDIGAELFAAGAQENWFDYSISTMRSWNRHSPSSQRRTVSR